MQIRALVRILKVGGRKKFLLIKFLRFHEKKFFSPYCPQKVGGDRPPCPPANEGPECNE